MFLSDETAARLLRDYGSPLYVYDEKTLRLRCHEVKSAFSANNFTVNYSTKANSNPELLKIIRDEGMDVDAMSPGEIYLEEMAGFTADQIFYIGNNVSAEEMKYAVEKGILVSVDSLSQLQLYGKTNPGGRVAIRFNPGVGDGHSEKVVTGGKKTKFGVQPEFIGEVKRILKEYNLRLAAINQHIGSQFLDETKYVDAVKNILEIASGFPGLDFVDFGGGFGVPYKKDENRLDLSVLAEKLSVLINAFRNGYENKNVSFRIEPGRFFVAECGVLLGTVNCVKKNYGVTYVGTDIGMNVLARPVLYDSYHEIEVVGKDSHSDSLQPVTVVGNICESGDIIAKGRLLPEIQEGDVLAVANAGAYGLMMSSNYNCRLKPAEVLVNNDGSFRLVRRRDSFEDLVRNYVVK